MADQVQVPTMQELAAEGREPEILFWVGCAGSFDERAQKITQSFVRILNDVGIDFAVLGKEESCTGDPAKRAGNEFVYQMQALQNIEVLNGYNIKKIVTTCPHCFNILKNEYPQLGGNYEVIHHSTFLQQLIDEGRIKLSDATEFNGKKITYHDSCYIGRGNGIYEAPRQVLETLDSELVEMNRSRKGGLCCGAGGAQMFKEEEEGRKRVSQERTDEALETGSDYIAVACPFCTNMLTDGQKGSEQKEKQKILDLAEFISKGKGLE